MAVQERAERTRSAIITAASESFETVGFSATSLARIAELADVTKGALYYHFSSKQELADAVCEAARQTLQPLVDGARTAATGAGRLQALIDLTHATVARLAADPVLRAGLRLTDERELGLPGPMADPDLLLLSRELLDPSGTGPAPRPYAEALGLVLSGLGLLFRRHPAAVTTERLAGIWRLLLPGLVGPEHVHRYRPEGSAAGPGRPRTGAGHASGYRASTGG